jgi:peptidoglycan hydrolase CwlO-like protein
MSDETSDLQEQVSALQSQVDALEAKVSAIQEQLGNQDDDGDVSFPVGGAGP